MSPEQIINILIGPGGALGAVSLFLLGFKLGWWHMHSTVQTKDDAIETLTKALADQATLWSESIGELKNTHAAAIVAANDEAKRWRELYQTQTSKHEELNDFVRQQAIPAIVRFMDLELNRGRYGSLD